MTGRFVALAALAASLAAGCEREGARGPDAEAPPDTGVLARLEEPVADGSPHLVRLASRGGGYAFEPAEVRVRAGDVVRFVLGGPQPESVAFDTAGLAPAAVSFVAARGLLRGPLLTEPGQIYEVSFADAPPGRYPFRSVPHATSGMRGVVVVME